MEKKETKAKANLMPKDMRTIVGCSDGTLRNYEKKGIIVPYRDLNGYRRYTKAQAFLLKNIFDSRYVDTEGGEGLGFKIKHATVECSIYIIYHAPLFVGIV